VISPSRGQLCLCVVPGLAGQRDADARARVHMGVRARAHTSLFYTANAG